MPYINANSQFSTPGGTSAGNRPRQPHLVHGGRPPALTHLNGLGFVDPSQWNSVKYPGVAKPMSFGSLGIFKDLQNQTNRLIKHYGGMSLIPVDGDIGPGTLSAVKAVAKKIGYFPPSAMNNVNDLAGVADVVAAAFKAAADNIGVTPSVPGPSAPPSAPPVAMLPPSMALPPPSGGLMAQLEPTLSGFPGGMTGALAVAGFIVIAIAQKKGWFKRKGKGARAMARARRRR